MKNLFFMSSLERHASRSAIISCILFLITGALFSTVSAEEVRVNAAKDLENITIRSASFPSGVVTLRNGEYRQPAASGSVSGTIVKLTDKRAFGKVDKRDIAAVVLATDSGGSGVFYDLTLLTMGKDGWVSSDTVMLGDRVKVHSVDIKDTILGVAMTIHGPADPLCCPTLRIERRFAVRENRLVQVGEERPDKKGGEILDVMWKWVNTVRNDDTKTVPGGSGRYELQLSRDGTIRIRADCNVGGGTYELKGNRLSITVTHTTLAACPEGSYADQFVHDLNSAAGFILKGDELFIELAKDTGTMKFTK